MAIIGARGLGRFSISLALGAGIATARFPVSVLIIVALSAIAHLEIAEVRVLAEPDLGWLVSALVAALAASVAVRLAAESHALSPVPLAVLPLGAALAMGLLVWFAEPLSVFAPPLVAALILAIPLAPYVARPDGKRFWVFTLWGGVGVTLAFVSVMLFVLGVSAILEMIRYLFEIGLSSDAYEHIYAAALTLVGPLFALGRIPRECDETLPVSGDDRLAAGVRFLFDWVGAPLALATAVVLHLYAAKIVLLGALPKNEIGWIVSFYALLVLSFRVAVEPFVSTPFWGGAPAVTTRLFGRLWAPMLVVPTALLVYAVGLRVGSEGVTEERYFLALGALAVALILLVQGPRRSRGDIRLISGVPLVLLALSSFGPWGMASVVARSQTDLVAEALAEAGVDATSGAITAETFTEGQKAELRSRLEALDEVDRVEDVLSLLPEAQRLEALSRSGRDGSPLAALLPELLHIESARTEIAETGVLVFNGGRESDLATAGFDLVLPKRTVGEDGSPRPAQDRETGLGLSGSKLVVYRRRITDSFDLSALFAAIPQSALMPGNPGPALRPIVADLVSDGGRRARLSISYALLEADRRAKSMEATLLIDSREWPAASLGGDSNAVDGGRGGADRETEPSGAVR